MIFQGSFALLHLTPILCENPSYSASTELVGVISLFHFIIPVFNSLPLCVVSLSEVAVTHS